MSQRGQTPARSFGPYRAAAHKLAGQVRSLHPYRAAVQWARLRMLVLLARIVPAAQKFAARARTSSPYRATVQGNRGFMARYGPKVRLAGTIGRTSVLWGRIVP